MGLLIPCLIWLLVYAIIAVIVIYIFEMILNMIFGAALPPQIFMLIRLLFVLLILVWFLGCVGLLSGPHMLGR